MSYSVQFIGNYTKLGGKFHTGEPIEVLRYQKSQKLKSCTEENRRIPKEF